PLRQGAEGREEQGLRPPGRALEVGRPLDRGREPPRGDRRDALLRPDAPRHRDPGERQPDREGRALAGDRGDDDPRAAGHRPARRGPARAVLHDVPAARASEGWIAAVERRGRGPRGGPGASCEKMYRELFVHSTDQRRLPYPDGSWLILERVVPSRPHARPRPRGPPPAPPRAPHAARRAPGEAWRRGARRPA